MVELAKDIIQRVAGLCTGATSKTRFRSQELNIILYINYSLRENIVRLCLLELEEAASNPCSGFAKNY